MLIHKIFSEMPGTENEPFPDQKPSSQSKMEQAILRFYEACLSLDAEKFNSIFTQNATFISTNRNGEVHLSVTGIKKIKTRFASKSSSKAFVK